MGPIEVWVLSRKDFIAEKLVSTPSRPKDLFKGGEGAVVWEDADGRVVSPTPDERGASQLFRDLLRDD